MFIATFTDPQGVEHIDAVLEASTANYNMHTNSNFDFRISQGDDATNKVTDDSVHASLTYQMFYWTNQEARDAGLLPYYLTNTAPLGEHFHVGEELLAKDEYLALSPAGKAEKHCKEEVLGVTV